MSQRTILWTVSDPRGLSITLTEDVWERIVAKHPDLIDQRDAVRRTVQDPDMIYFDPDTTAMRKGPRIYWYYRAKLATSEHKRKYTGVVVKVVSEIGSEKGYVQTAWSPDRIQPRLVIEWKK